jgi:hypothetical protein
LLLITSEANGRGSFPLVLAGLALVLVAFGVTLLGSLAAYCVTPAVTLGVLDGGIGGGFALPTILRRTTRSTANTLLAGLMLLAAGFIGGLGVYVFVVGIVITSPYALAMEAWIIRSFEEASSV